MGQTPLMAAVAERAYRAALVILDAIRACADADDAQRAAAIFPPNAHPDHSPLLVLCCNDTCSFTWTGQEHINQVFLSPTSLYSQFTIIFVISYFCVWTCL